MAGQPHMPRKRKTNGLAIASVSCGGASLACTLASCIPLIGCLFCLAFPILSIAGIVTGIISINQIGSSGDEGKSLAMTGIGLSIGAFVIWGGLIAIQFFFMGGIELMEQMQQNANRP